ncbi:MAG: tetratricopeptide repeat protein [Acidobacteriota bacterium]
MSPDRPAAGRTKKAPARKPSTPSAGGKPKGGAARSAGTARTRKQAGPAKKQRTVRAGPTSTGSRSTKGSSRTRSGSGVDQPGPAQTVPPSDYQEALARYSQCLELLQKKDWKQASRALADFISRHGGEQELSERARMYLRICSQQLDSNSFSPQSFDDLCFLAVILANKGEFREALTHLKGALAKRPDSDKAFYLQAATYALKRDRRKALDALKHAIALDDRNRIYAANNPDFGCLRDDEEFITLTTREDEEY